MEEKVREWRAGDVADQTKAHAYILTNIDGSQGR